MRPVRPILVIVLLTAALAVEFSRDTVQAQNAISPAVPLTPVPTVWQKLGIPQTFDRLNSSLVNRRGNFPGLEKKPPLKRLADPANLESKNPAIKKAAEVKMQEDMAKQKIKGIKYLAELGCDDCYPGITEALIAALDDCTEKVRFEAAKAIKQSVRKNCDTCSKKCCCKEEMTKKLAEVAFELDDECCFKERSERVRKQAEAALRVCCPNCLPEGMPIEVPLETVPPAEGPQGTAPAEGPAQQNPTPAEEITPPGDGNTSARLELPAGDGSDVVVLMDGAPQPATVRISDVEAPGSRQVSPLRVLPLGADDLTSIEQSGSAPRVEMQSERHAAKQARHSANANRVAAKSVSLAQPRSEQRADEAVDASSVQASPVHSAASGGTIGQVMSVDSAQGVVRLKFRDGRLPRVGARVRVFHDYLLERAELGELTVVEAIDGTVAAQPLGNMPLEKIARGDSVVVR